MRTDNLLAREPHGLAGRYRLLASFPRPRLRKVSDPGVAQCAERPYAVRKALRSLHRM